MWGQVRWRSPSHPTNTLQRTDGSARGPPPHFTQTVQVDVRQLLLQPALLAFVPQALVLAATSLKLHQDLPLCCLVQTICFVAFNKVGVAFSSFFFKMGDLLERPWQGTHAPVPQA